MERLARWKINELQLYIENVFAFKRHPAIWRGFSPLTTEEIVALQEHCTRHHVRLVPSLSSFGHLETVLGLPQYRQMAELPGTLGKPGGTTLCPGDRRSIKFIEELYEEFVPLFTAKDFNVCCDETWELGRGRSKARAARVGVGRLYLEFLLKIHRLCGRFGKRMNAWADIVLDHPELLREIPRDVVMLNWEYNAKGARIPRTKEIARAGLPFMVCSGTSSWCSHGTRLDNAIANVANFAAEGRRQGAEGLLNTDWGDLGHRNTLGVSLHGYAHGAAHAWYGAGVDDRGFTDAFCFHVFRQQDTRLAAAVRLVGNSHNTIGSRNGKGADPYHMLVEPFQPGVDGYRGIDPRSPVFFPPDWRHSRIDAATPAGLRAVIEQLSARNLWPAPVAGLDAFERLTLEEYALAARMDVLAARRGLIGQAVRAGASVSATEAARVAVGLREMAREFERLWLARSKPSRLRDNLTLIQRAAREAEQVGSQRSSWSSGVVE